MSVDWRCFPGWFVELSPAAAYGRPADCYRPDLPVYWLTCWTVSPPLLQVKRVQRSAVSLCIGLCLHLQRSGLITERDALLTVAYSCCQVVSYVSLFCVKWISKLLRWSEDEP